MPRSTSPDLGLSAIAAWNDGAATRQQLASATRYTLELLEHQAPGHSVEVRVPPFGAVQVVEGPRHTRGTPPNVIETDADTWLQLVTGQLTWADALMSAKITASGERCDLINNYLPLL